MRQAVFLDRDGVLNRPIFRNGRSYAPTRYEDFALFPDAASSVARLKDAGYLCVVVTNQPDVGRGDVPREEVERMHETLRRDVAVDAVYCCWHTGEALCDCRKPSPGMLQDAAQAYEIDLSRSIMVGDRWRDIGAGQAAGCGRNFFIDYGYDERQPEGDFERVADLSAAVELILAD